ncbi:MAG: hypothetical protein JOY77_11045 [Alphaproteobacteria bacterium]|nr:hypothetical protein [Alphaproteobacteria bacterium]
MTRAISRVLLAGTCALALATPVSASTFTVLHTFKGGKDGANSNAAITPDGQGNLYGTTEYGGGKGCGEGGCGTVFRIAGDGTYAVIYAFKGGSDGANPVAGVTLAPDGSLYGTTSNGGGAAFCSGCGTVYRIAPDGKESVIYAFQGDSDGAYPSGSVALDKKGNIYGTTAGGGPDYQGTIFRISPKGKETQLHSCDGFNCSNPASNVVFDKAGNLFGASPFGGDFGPGAIFKISPQGVFSVLYSFTGSLDGYQPYSDLTIDKDGTLFGTTVAGGENNFGVVYRVTSAGSESVVHSFAPGDGAGPMGGVVLDSKGNVFGTTSAADGDGGPGNIFEVASDGSERVLHTFSGGKDGFASTATLAWDATGNLYGTSFQGGLIKGHCSVYGCGTVFRVTP